MRRLKMTLQHSFNPLHVFCRLKDLGFAPATARKMCVAYERWLYHPLAWIR